MRAPERDAVWYGRKPPPVHWRAAAFLFRVVSAARRRCYRSGLFRSGRPDRPVVVVGNVTAGGTGKTPLVLWIVEILQAADYRPGVVSRGYGGSHRGGVLEVGSDTDPAVAGDEPVLMARHTGLPVAVCRDRAAAARYLVDRLGVNVVIADDGLQHYGLGRDVEICVIDGTRRFGNGRLLPAGPLREPVDRVGTVDFVVANGRARDGEIGMGLALADPLPVDGGERRALDSFREGPVHAVAGIGNPERFFAQLETAGLTITRHPFPDHHAFTPEDLEFGDPSPVLMTEKDAVKCRRLGLRNAWYVPVAVQLPDSFRRALLDKVEALRLPVR